MSLQQFCNLFILNSSLGDLSFLTSSSWDIENWKFVDPTRPEILRRIFGHSVFKNRHPNRAERHEKDLGTFLISR